MIPDISIIKKDPEVEAIMEMTENQIKARKYTEHSRRHAGIVSKWAADILRGLEPFSSGL